MFFAYLFKLYDVLMYFCINSLLLCSLNYRLVLYDTDVDQFLLISWWCNFLRFLHFSSIKSYNCWFNLFFIAYFTRICSRKIKKIVFRFLDFISILVHSAIFIFLFTIYCYPPVFLSYFKKHNNVSLVIYLFVAQHFRIYWQHIQKLVTNTEYKGRFILGCSFNFMSFYLFMAWYSNLPRFSVSIQLYV